jgi:zinc protease
MALAIMKKSSLMILCLSLLLVPVPIQTDNTPQTIIINPVYIMNITNQCSPSEHSMSAKNQFNETVHKFILPNGLTVLVFESHTLPKVSVQLWYGVGSRDEADKERGLAHLLEHMIFKGTHILSESDINVITHQLSGSCNAFTSYDYTGYLFNFPTQNWTEALPILADCMTNCRFDSQMLNSEMKAVIQELKMYRDRYVSSLVSEMISTIFSDHPYHHPIIGYKQDLWSVTSEMLHAFYKKHYIPNNATLVVTGDVKAQEVVAMAQKYFGSIPANHSYTRKEPYFNNMLITKSVTLYRDIKQPIYVYAFLVPGTKDKKDYPLQALAWIIGKGKSSRLYTELVEKEQLATSVDASYDDLFDHGLFFIVVEPKDIQSIERIKNIITKTLDDITEHGFLQEELTKAVKQTQMGVYDLLEDTEHQAYEIGKYFLATGDPEYPFTFIKQPIELLQNDMRAIAKNYLRPVLMHEGSVLPLPEQDLDLWHKIQQESDEEDTRILAAHPRTLEVEPPRHALTIHPRPSQPFNFPKATVSTLANGLKTFMYRHTVTPTVDIQLDLKIDETYDPLTKQGLTLFMTKLLTEGTQDYSATKFAHALESRGITLNVGTGSITMNLLREDVPFALEMLDQMIRKALFEDRQIEKVREKLLSQLKHFWDDALSCATQLVKETLYKNHPYAHNAIGTIESISSITKKDLYDFYKKYVSPKGARIAIVGDIDEKQMVAEIERKLGKWHGESIPDMSFPPLAPVPATRLQHYLNRDQVALIFARLSVNRLDPDFDKLLLFDQILGGGTLGSMSSRLFDLRERSGLFYTIKGSLTANAYEQPGMFMVRTIVSLDSVAQAEKAILDTLKTSADSVTPEELEEAKRAVEASMIENFKSNSSMASVFLFLDRYHLPATYYDNRIATLEKITLNEMQQAVHKVLKPDDLVIMTAGRCGAE